MVPVCDKRYHIYNRFRHFWAEIKKLWNYPLNKNTSTTEKHFEEYEHSLPSKFQGIIVQLYHQN